MDKKRTPKAKAQTLDRKRQRKNKERACNGVPCVGGCPMVACK